MNFRPSTVERAYQLAKSGDCDTLSAVKDRLRAEGFHDVNGQLYGKTIGDDLRKLCTRARTEREAAEPLGTSAEPVQNSDAL